MLASLLTSNTYAASRGAEEKQAPATEDYLQATCSRSRIKAKNYNVLEIADRVLAEHWLD